MPLTVAVVGERFRRKVLADGTVVWEDGPLRLELRPDYAAREKQVREQTTGLIVSSLVSATYLIVTIVKSIRNAIIKAKLDKAWEKVEIKEQGEEGH